MLRTFLTENKISLARLTSPRKPVPASQPTIPILEEQIYPQYKQKPASEPLISEARSPPNKRRKIFQRINSPQSKLTADFGEVPNYSTVQAYQMPQGENRPIKRKTGKINKENGLCLARARSKDILKMPSNIHSREHSPQGAEDNDRLESYREGESRRQQRVEQLQRYNRQLEREIEQRRQEEGSLIIVEPNCETFTFQSRQSSLIGEPSLTYSQSQRGQWKEPSIQLIQTETELQSPLQLQ